MMQGSLGITFFLGQTGGGRLHPVAGQTFTATSWKAVRRKYQWSASRTSTFVGTRRSRRMSAHFYCQPRVGRQARQFVKQPQD